MAKENVSSLLIECKNVSSYFSALQDDLSIQKIRLEKLYERNIINNVNYSISRKHVDSIYNLCDFFRYVCNRTRFLASSDHEDDIPEELLNLLHYATNVLINEGCIEKILL